MIPLLVNKRVAAKKIANSSFHDSSILTYSAYRREEGGLSFSRGYLFNNN